MTYKMAGPTKWRKILYEDQGVPDNYVDSTFLVELKKNLHTRNYSYWPVVCESGTVTQQFSSVCIFVVAFIYMWEKWLSPEELVGITFLLCAGGYTLHAGLAPRPHSSRSVIDDLKTGVLFLGITYALSPVLVSLTETISTDTIYTMTTLSLLANLLFHDYGASTAIVSGALSLNAATFASICLASRLHSAHHAFALVTFSVEVFALWPMLRRNLKNSWRWSQVALTVSLGVTALLALLSVSVVAAVVFALSHCFVTFLCPLWLVRLQPFKNNIHGPWDEAVIEEQKR